MIIFKRIKYKLMKSNTANETRDETGKNVLEKFWSVNLS